MFPVVKSSIMWLKCSDTITMPPAKPPTPHPPPPSWPTFSVIHLSSGHQKIHWTMTLLMSVIIMSQKTWGWHICCTSVCRTELAKSWSYMFWGFSDYFLSQSCLVIKAETEIWVNISLLENPSCVTCGRSIVFIFQLFFRHVPVLGFFAVMIIVASAWLIIIPHRYNT